MFCSKQPRGRSKHRVRRSLRKSLQFEQVESRELLAVFTVSSSLDDGGATTLRAAVDMANTTPGPDSIVFNGVTSVDLTQSAPITISDSLTIDGTSMLPVLVSITAAPDSRIFTVDDGDPGTSIAVTMNQLALLQGDVSTDMLDLQGGAIRNEEDLTLMNSLFSSNVALEGGALANFGSVTINGCDFSENMAYGAGGGAIWNAPGSVAHITASSLSANSAAVEGGGILAEADSVVTLTGNTLVGNNEAINGGGVAVKDAAVAHIPNATISSNTATIGGGLFVTGLGSQAHGMNATTISQNTARTGAGVAASSQGAVSLRGSLVTGNIAGGDGGGLAATAGSDVELIGAEVISNSAGTNIAPARGGGIFVEASLLSLQGGNVSYNGLSPLVASIEGGGGVFAGGSAIVTAAGTRFNQNRAAKGGAIFGTGGNVDGTRTDISLTNVIVENSTALAAGGGVFAANGVILSVTSSTISGNSATQGSGGGIQLEGGPGLDNSVDATLANVTVSLNVASTSGGGVFAFEGVNLGISQSTIATNTASNRGGGVFASGGDDTNGSNTVTITRSLISGNEAVDSIAPVSFEQAGGGVWAGNGALMLIGSTTISANRAGLRGGGMNADATGMFQVQNSTVTGNAAHDGAGAAVGATDATFLQTTFYGNNAQRDGGGIHVIPGVGTLVEVNHSTLSLNSAGGNGNGEGGAIYVGPAAVAGSVFVSLDHTVVSTNLGPPLGGFDEIFDAGTAAGSSQVSARYSLLRDNTDTLLVPANPADPFGNIIGSQGLPVDALLQPLANNGGPTMTMKPSPGSPIIDAGDPQFVGPPDHDQRLFGFARVVRRIDIGSVEVQPSPDFDGDGDADCDDVDALTARIAQGVFSSAFDLNVDGIVNRADLLKWLDDAPGVNGINIDHYLEGDANLDTVVDGTDFIIWNNFKFTATAAWCSGDFNADGVVDGQDFVIWNSNKFTQSPSIAPADDSPTSGLSGTLRPQIIEQPNPSLNTRAPVASFPRGVALLPVTTGQAPHSEAANSRSRPSQLYAEQVDIAFSGMLADEDDSDCLFRHRR